MNRRIILEGLDGCGKSTIAKELASSLNMRYTKYPSDNVIEANNTILNKISSKQNEIKDSVEKNKFNYPGLIINMNEYYHVINLYKDISNLYLELTYTQINDQRLDHLDNSDSVNDRCLISAFIYNYMEYVFFNKIHTYLLSFEYIEYAYLEYRCMIFNGPSIKRLIDDAYSSTIKYIKKSDTIIEKCWIDFNNLLEFRSKITMNPFDTDVIVLDLDQNFRMNFLHNEKSNDIKYKAILESDENQIRYNIYMQLFRSYILRYNKNISNNDMIVHIKNIHFIDSGHFNANPLDPIFSSNISEYKRFPVDVMINKILGELK